MTSVLRRSDCGHAARTQKGKLLKDIPRDWPRVPAECPVCARQERERAKAAEKGITVRELHEERRRNEMRRADAEAKAAADAERRAAELAAWFPEARRVAGDELRKHGFRCTRRGRKSSLSSYYENGDDLRVRVSDHHIPPTPEREHAARNGARGAADIDIVFDAPMDLDEVRKTVREAIN